MRFKKSDNSYFELDSIGYRQNILIDYELIELSNANFSSIDRGEQVDKYKTELSFDSENSYITELLQELYLLRLNQKEVLIDQFEERVFGDHIDHSGVIYCVVDGITPEQNETLNTSSTKITFNSTGVSYVSGGGIPESINCLQSGFKGFSIWNTKVNEAYNGDNYQVDREADTYIFDGSYIFSEDENASMFNFWRTQRGEPFIINDTDFGTSLMFGANGGNTTHKVIITNIEYEKISPIFRQTKIELVKVG